MELNEKERITFEIIKKVVDGDITRKEAEFELNKSRQQIYRLINIYKSEGEDGFVHKNRGRNNPNKIDRDIIEKLENLYLTEYHNFNFEHFFEKIKDEYSISYPSLHRTFLEHDIISPLAHKGTIKLYTEKMNSAINNKGTNVTNEKIELFKSRQITIEKARTRKSTNLYSFGQEVQMDACEKVWFGNVVTHLHLAVDKGTKKVLFGWFEYEEITRGYFILLFNIRIKSRLLSFLSKNDFFFYKDIV